MLRNLAFALTLLLSCSAHGQGLPARHDDGPVLASLHAERKPNHVVFEGPVDAESVNLFLFELRAAEEEGSVVFVEINTPGGSVMDGMRMGKAIEDSPADVVCNVDGFAASMGFYILQSCDKRIMTSRSLLMGHEPSGMSGGQPTEHENVVSLLKALNHALATHIARRSTLSVREYEALIEGGKELWLTDASALELGFVDQVTEK